MTLRDELDNPKPRGIIHRYFEKRCKARHAMVATIAGVIIAVVLGFLSLGVSIFQAWVSYQQWKGQVTDGSAPQSGLSTDKPVECSSK